MENNKKENTIGSEELQALTKRLQILEKHMEANSNYYVNSKLQCKPAFFKNGFPFELDFDVLAQIGFAMRCFDDYRLLNKDFYAENEWEWIEQTFSLSCIMQASRRYTRAETLESGYFCMEQTLQTAFGLQAE